MDVDDSAAVAAGDASHAAFGGGADSAALMEILMDDDELDAMAELAETPVAGQISHSQIIEKQAHSIAKLEKQVARAEEYKKLTKVKLREAAMRLREYRLKVEALMGEVEQLKTVQQASEKKLKLIQKQSGSGGEQVPGRYTEGPATGRGKGGRGRGRGRGGSTAATAVSNVAASIEEKPAVETNSIGVQAEIQNAKKNSQDMVTQSYPTSVKSFLDAVTQTKVAAEERVVAATETGMLAQVEISKKCVDSGSQTTVSGEIRVVSAAAVSVGLQTEKPSAAEFGCQCDLLPEENSVDRIFNSRSSQQSGGVSATSRSPSAVAADVEEAKTMVSRKRKRSFESTGRGEQPKPSALLAKQAQLVNKSDVKDDEMVRATQARADMETGVAASCTIENGESDRGERSAIQAAEMKQKESEENVFAGASSKIEQATIARDHAEISESRSESTDLTESSSSLSRKPDGESTSDNPVPATQNHPKPLAEDQIDAVGAEIDAELDFSDSDDEDMEGGQPGVANSKQQNNELANPLPARRSVALDAAVCDEIDKELDFGSSDDEEDRTEAASPKRAMPLIGDAVSAAIDDELASSDEEEELSQASPSKTPAGPTTVATVSKDPISAAIDDELTSSSDNDEEDKPENYVSTIQVAGTAVAAAIDNELASISEDDEEEVPKDHASTAPGTDAVVTAAIDDELTSSSDEETDKMTTAQPTTSTFSAIKDPISAAIDGELASSSDEEDVADPAVQSVVEVAFTKHDPIGAAVDDELASSSDEEDSTDQAIRPEGALFAVNINPVAKAIDDELASSSDDKVDKPGAKQVLATGSAVDDPIGAAIDDELASSSDDEELENHTDKPSPPSPSGANDTVDDVAINPTSSLDDGTKSSEHPIKVAEESRSAAPNVLADETVARPESGSVEVTTSSSSTEKDFVGDVELPSSSDEEESEKQGPSPSDTEREAAVKDQGASAEVKLTACDIDETALSKDPPTPSPASTPENLLPYQEAVPAADAIGVPDRNQLESNSGGARSPQRLTQLVVVGVQAAIDERIGGDQVGDSTLVSGDTVKANGASTLSLSSSSDSNGSDSSGSSSDSEEDHGMDYEPQDVESEVPIEKATLSPPPAKPTGAHVAQRIDEDPQEESILTKLVRNSARQVEKIPDGSETHEKLLPTQPPVLVDASKSDTTIAAVQLNAETGVAASGQDDSRDQSSPKKRPRAESSLSADPVESDGVQSNTCSSTGKTSSKRQKLHEDDALPESTETISNNEKKDSVENSNAKAGGKDVSSTAPQLVQPKLEPIDPQTKHLVAFQHDIARKDKENEKTDDVFVSRTLTVLLRYSAKQGASDSILVAKFCRFLAADYRKKDISPMVLVKGTCIVLRSPRVRHLIENHALGVCFLAHQVLLGLVGVNNQSDDVQAVAEADKYLLAECLEYLRSLLLGEREAASAPTDVFAQVQSAHAHKNAVSHDKEFIAHVCLFYTRICKAIGFDECARVLLFDLLRRNPNIKGLYFTCFIVEVAPELLWIEYDKRGRAQEVLLRDTIHHALAVITTQSGRRQELLFQHSSLNILHQIAKYIHADSLLEVDAEDPAFTGEFATKVWENFIIPLAKRKMAQDENDLVFEVCKGLELLATVYEHRQTMKLYPIERFQDAFAASENSQGKAALLRMVGAIAVVFAESITLKVSKARDSIAHDAPGSTSADYVLCVCDWLQKLLRQGESANDQSVDVQVASAAVCVQLIAVSAATRERRDEMLCDVLEWFRLQSHELQMSLSGSLLRQLRFVTVTTRPVMPVARRG